MKTSKLIATLALSALLFTGCGFKSQNALIKVNDGVITQKQFDKLMDRQLSMSPLAKLAQGNVKADENSFIYLMTEQRVVNQLIVQELMDQEAKARNIKVSNKDVDEAIKKIMDKVGGKDALMDILKRNNVSVSQFKKDLKNQIKMRKLAQASAKIEVTDADIKKFYDKNKAQFKYPDEVRASHILLFANADQMKNEISSDPKNKLSQAEIDKKVEKQVAEKKALANKLVNELKQKPELFEQYAKKYSEDEGTAKQGGDLGFFPKGKMVPAFEKAAFSMKPNTVSDVVESPFGYHIIKVTDRKEAGIVPLEKAKSDISEYLSTEQELKALDNLTIAAKKKSKIEFADEKYDPEVINKKLKEQIGKLTQGAQKQAPAKSKK